MHHFEQGVPHSTSSLGDGSVRKFWERKEDLLAGRAFNGLASQGVIIQEAVVSTDNCGYWSKTAYRQWTRMSLVMLANISPFWRHGV
jgi:hypothetical protein